MADLTDTIKAIPLFSELPRSDVAKILGKLEEITFTAGTRIFSQGDPGDAFYLIQSGSVSVVLEGGDGRSETIAVLGPHHWFGEMALLSGEPRSATIRAIKDTTAWRLNRDNWDELIEGHPGWLFKFCATLSKRLTRIEHQYSKGREAFNLLAEEYYSSRPAEEQAFLRRASLVQTLDVRVVSFLLKTDKGQEFLKALQSSQLPMVRTLNDSRCELQPLFKEFLMEKLVVLEGPFAKRQLHAQLATLYESLQTWDQAIQHYLEAEDWGGASHLLLAHREELLQSSASFLESALNRMPPECISAELRLVHLKADLQIKLGNPEGAIRTYKEILAQRTSGIVGAESITRYRDMANVMAQKRDYSQALQCLRSALRLTEQETANLSWEAAKPYRVNGEAEPPVFQSEESALKLQGRQTLIPLVFNWAGNASPSKWFGAILGLLVWAYFWFWTPEIGLEPYATKQLGVLCLTLIYWVFWVFPDYGVALIFALTLVLTKLAPVETVLGGFASTTWFMTLGVLGLGAAITSCGLFYRFSLQLVRFFPLTYYWQTIALGIMGVVVMALIPQQSARTAIISQMLQNLSESLSYKTPSKASTGLFVASFLGLGQLGFLFLTGSTTSLIAWGLLPADVRAQFTWGYWFLAALPPTLVVIVFVLLATVFLYRPETQPQLSYKMVQNQLEVLGALSSKEWITLGALFFTVGGWLTFSYHGIDGAWISLIGFCVLINTGVLGWGLVKKAIDWELLLYMGATLGIPALLTRAKIDEWLVGLLSPFILPFVEYPAVSFVIICLISYAFKLVFTSFLTVVTLTVALLPLSIDMGISPWIMAMLVLVGSEVWFFRFQVDWHTLAYSTTEGKGFSYQFMNWINPVYAVAYILALLASIPYWRYLGLMG
ncbi:MAG: anion permease [Deltaproteobacteria bacterium]|nr:anion permease [Deltaproteobacteria bacterium]